MSDPRIWGTDQWKAMHRFSLAYPQSNPSAKHRRAARHYFESLQYLLPCIGCRSHYAKHFRSTFRRSTTDSRVALARWVYDLHEAVNRRLGKPTGQIEFEELPKLYNVFPTRYIALDGKSLLEQPRFTTVANDYAGADVAIDTDAAVRKAIRVRSTLQDSDQQQPSNASAGVPANALQFAIIAVLALGIVAAIVAIYVVYQRRRRKQRGETTTPPATESSFARRSASEQSSGGTASQ